MMSLRTKFTLALLFTSFAAIATVGFIANSLIYNRFSTVSMEQAFKRYQNDVTAYAIQYGSFEEAQKVERFGQFQRRRQALVGNFRQQPSQPLPKIEPNNNPNVPPPLLDEIRRPPFQFLLIDKKGTVLLGSNIHKKGANVVQLLKGARPIKHQDTIIAYAVPIGKANITAIDRSYFDAIRQALVYGIIAATLAALLLGLFFSKRLTAPLQKLTQAIRNMQSGDYHQIVQTKTNDEVGGLINAFNAMSERLATAYRELESSHETIQAQAERLKELSIKDALTQLYNRRYFDESSDKIFEHAKRHQHSLVYMIGDIDLFKKINDQFSHATGDEVLRRVAEIFRNNTRKNDIAARYGGEEFVIVFPETTLEKAASLCERLRKSIKDYNWQTIHPDLNVTISMGLNADTSLDSFEKMLEAADQKLYQAKQNGRDQIQY